jgi:hypothetical protein
MEVATPRKWLVALRDFDDRYAARAYQQLFSDPPRKHAGYEAASLRPRIILDISAFP